MSWYQYPGYNDTCSECGFTDDHAVECSRGPGVPTRRVAPAKCECGTGVHTRSGCHSHWCPMWVAS